MANTELSKQQTPIKRGWYWLDGFSIVGFMLVVYSGALVINFILFLLLLKFSETDIDQFGIVKTIFTYAGLYFPSIVALAAITHTLTTLFFQNQFLTACDEAVTEKRRQPFKKYPWFYRQTDFLSQQAGWAFLVTTLSIPFFAILAAVFSMLMKDQAIFLAFAITAAFIIVMQVIRHNSFYNDDSNIYPLIETMQVENAPKVTLHKPKKESAIVELIKTPLYTLRSFFFILMKTPYMILPSAAHTSMVDNQYNKDLMYDLAHLIDKIDATNLDDNQKEIIKRNWLSQVEWTNDRSTRERDANELIRWWQIILGVLIPVIVNMDVEFLPQKDVIVSIAGIFVAILTAIYQFRRPEERWRHYRLTTERYLIELWNYVAQSDPKYSGKTHKEMFIEFNNRMTLIRQEDINRFFGEVIPTTTEGSKTTTDGRNDTLIP